MAYYLTHWLLASLCLLATSYIVPGFHVASFEAALIAALVVGLLNIFVWPLLFVLTLPATILTFGLFLFVVNALVLKLGTALTPGFSITGFWPAIVGALVLTVLGWLVRFTFGS